MKLLFDLSSTQPSSIAVFHGGGKYGWVVFRECIRQKIAMGFIYDSRRMLPDDIYTIINSDEYISYDIAKMSYHDILASKEYSVYYTPLDKPDVKKKIPRFMKYITTVHGLRDIEMPQDWMFLRYSGYLNSGTIKQKLYRLAELFFYKTMKNRMINFFRNGYTKDDEIIVVSNHTKYACLSNCPQLREENIKVFYSPSTTPISAGFSPYNIEDNYIFMVSGNRHEKNVLRAIIAIDSLMSERYVYKRYKVLIAGAKEGTYKYHIRNKENFVFLGYVDEQMLYSIYEGAYLFVYPSLNEGFGYPPIEAMKYGVPVIASPHTSISEICGDAALYCNPYDISEIKGRIIRLLSDRNTYEEYKKRSYCRYEFITQKQKADLEGFVAYLSQKC